MRVGVAQAARALGCGPRDGSSSLPAHPICSACGDRPAQVRGRCRRCDLRVSRDSDPRRFLRFTGHPCRCGCGRLARGRSGLAKLCYNRGYYRVWRWERVVRNHFGTSLTTRQIAEGLAWAKGDGLAQDAIAVCRRLMVEFSQGRLYVARTPGTKT